ncbi:hypothetical protein GF356_02470 [candidate division GN15 bacterium]|nr:hypothetical protein [candidate division GN15 bacterium]
MRVSRFIIPVLVVVALLVGYSLRLAFTQPTTNISYARTGDTIENAQQATFIVEGVKCKGTASFFSSLYEDTPGVIAIETFASEHKAVFTYDPDVIGIEQIKSIMEAPIDFDDGTSEQVFRCLAVE